MEHLLVNVNMPTRTIQLQRSNFVHTIVLFNTSGLIVAKFFTVFRKRRISSVVLPDPLDPVAGKDVDSQVHHFHQDLPGKRTETQTIKLYIR